MSNNDYYSDVTIRVLQQMFRDPRGGDHEIWLDVPVSSENAPLE